MTGDAAADDDLEPGLERTSFRGLETSVTQSLGHSHDGFLHDVTRVLVRQAGLDRDAVEEFPVGVEEIAPALLVVPAFETAQQTRPRRNELVRTRKFVCRLHQRYNRIVPRFLSRKICGRWKLTPKLYETHGVCTAW